LLWPPYVIRQAIYIFILWFLLSFFYFPRLISAVGDWMSTILPHMTWPNLECRSETCCVRLAENTAREKIAKKSPSGHHPTNLSGYIFATKACIDNISSTCPRNMVNFGPLAAEIVSLVWGTPGNFKGFRALAALLHGSQVVSVSQTLRR